MSNDVEIFTKLLNKVSYQLQISVTLFAVEEK
jgi:hypothetical protein